MTWTVVNNTKTSGLNGVTTTGFDSRGTTGRKKVAYVGICGFTGGTPNPPTFVDSASNTWTRVKNDLAQSIVNGVFYRCLNPTTAASHTVTTTGTGIAHTVFFIVFETDAAGSIQVDTGKPTSNAETNANVNVKPGAATPTGNALLAAFAAHGGTTGQACSVLTLRDSVDYLGGTTVGGALAWKSFTSGGGSQDPQFSWTVNTQQDHMAFLDVVLEGVTSNLALTERAAGAVIPHDVGQTYATQSFEFVWNESLTTPSSAEVQVYDTDGTTILQAWASPQSAPSFGGSPSTGTWRIPGGRSSRFKIRTKDGGGSVIETSAVTTNVLRGVGTIITEVGQSHLARMHDIASSPGAANAAGGIMDYTGTWFAPAGNGDVALLNALTNARATDGVGGTPWPFGIVRSGIGGAGWGVDGGAGAGYYYSGGQWKDGSTANQPFDKYKTHCNQLLGLGKPYGAIILGGSSDAIHTFAHSEATITADLNTTWTTNVLAYHSLSASQFKAFVCVNGRANDGGSVNTTDADWEACKQTDLKFARDQTGAVLAAMLIDLPLADEYHLTADGYARLGKRIAQSILKAMSIVTYDGASLKITNASRIYGSTDIMLSITPNGGSNIQETDGTTDGASLNGWEATVDDTWADLTISSTAFVGAGPNQVRLRLSAAPANSDVVKVRYLYGVNPTVTRLVYDNSTPGADTLGVPLVETIGSVSVSASAGVGFLERLDRDRPATKIRVETPPSAPGVLLASTIPIPISGMAWFEPRENDRRNIGIRIESPPPWPAIPLAPAVISGVAWFEPPGRDRQMRAVIRVATAPALILTRTTLPATISGIGWFRDTDHVVKLHEVSFDYPPAFGPSVQAPICYVAVSSIMRNVVVAVSGDMSNLPVGAVAELC